MIFTLRLIIFSALILLGFHISLRSVTGKKIVTVIYTLTLLWYTFLCRLPLFTSVPAAADDGLPSQPATTVTLWEKFFHLIVAIFGSQPDGTLAGGGVFKAVVFNALLFVPLGFLLLLWIPQLREKRKGQIVAILIALGISLTIECVQELTGLGMGDPRDTMANVAGAGIGVGMVYIRDWREKRAVIAHSEK